MTAHVVPARRPLRRLLLICAAVWCLVSISLARVHQIFYTHAVAAIIVYDVTSRETFDSVLKWKQDIDAKVFLPSGAKIPVLLLGNKCDLLVGENAAQSCVPPEEMKRFLEEHQFFAQSAKPNHPSSTHSRRVAFLSLCVHPSHRAPL